MANSVKLMKQWFDTIREDENLGDITEQELAYVIYAAVHYGFSSEKINIGAIFGNEFKTLNYIMPNIYSQIDNIQNYGENKVKAKYDDEAIYNLRLEGLTAKQICERLGYDVNKANSLTSNKGWIKANKERSVQKSTDSGTEKHTETVQKSGFDF